MLEKLNKIIQIFHPIIKILTARLKNRVNVFKKSKMTNFTSSKQSSEISTTQTQAHLVEKVEGRPESKYGRIEGKRLGQAGRGRRRYLGRRAEALWGRAYRRNQSRGVETCDGRSWRRRCRSQPALLYRTRPSLHLSSPSLLSRFSINAHLWFSCLSFLILLPFTYTLLCCFIYINNQCNWREVCLDVNIRIFRQFYISSF